MKTQTGKPATIICFACVSFNCRLLRSRSSSDEEEANEFALIIFIASFTIWALAINENIFAAREHRNTTEDEGKEKKQRSEQQNRRKFLFILFVIISFLHYEYLRLDSSLPLSLHFIFTQKAMQPKL